MLNFFKKDINKNLYSPVNGKCIDITDVQDKVFSSKVMGDGFAIKPQSDIISSPCEGVITMIFPTKHAFGIQMKDGKEILVHIGIDTVNLNGEGFESLVKINEKVKVGDAVIKINKESIEKKYDITTMVIITNSDKNQFKKENIGKTVSSKELIMIFE